MFRLIDSDLECLRCRRLVGFACPMFGTLTKSYIQTISTYYFLGRDQVSTCIGGRSLAASNMASDKQSKKQA